MSNGGRIVLFLLLGSLGKIFAAGAVAPTKAEVEAMYSRAAHELNAGNYGETLKLLDELDQRQPDVAAAQNLRGVALMRMGEFGPAEKALQKARDLEPDLWEARFNLAEVPFLAKNWSEARKRFTTLADSFPSQAEGATGDLIQFKILLTYLLQDKETKANAIAARLKTSSVSPAYYYSQAAFALRQKDETGARVNFRAAEKGYSERLNRLFLESFYEVGWLRKPDQEHPATLEVISEAARVTNAQTDFENAERAFRRGELDRALELLGNVDATAPNQAVSYNLRGEILLEQGNLREAEAALQNALHADPQFLEARINLARIPFKKGDYETARKELESLLGATSSNKKQTLREQLIRYQIFLTLLRQGRESAAQKAMEAFKMTDETPALYYAQAAWAYEQGNWAQGSNWIANANNLFSTEMNRDFAKPFADLGWTGKQTEIASAPRETRPKISAPGNSGGSTSVPPVESSPAKAVAESTPAAPTPAAKENVAETKPNEEMSDTASVPAETKRETGAKKSTRSEAASKVGRSEGSNEAKPTTAARAKPVRKSRPQQRETRSRTATAIPKTSPQPSPGVVPQPTPTPAVRQNLGDKVVRLLLYPFQRREKTPPKTAPPRPGTSPAASATPAAR
jgi:tetratricopeptide (TPR) repeat protein